MPDIHKPEGLVAITFDYKLVFLVELKLGRDNYLPLSLSFFVKKDLKQTKRIVT